MTSKYQMLLTVCQAACPVMDVRNNVFLTPKILGLLLTPSPSQNLPTIIETYGIERNENGVLIDTKPVDMMVTELLNYFYDTSKIVNKPEWLIHAGL